MSSRPFRLCAGVQVVLARYLRPHIARQLLRACCRRPTSGARPRICPAGSSRCRSMLARRTPDPPRRVPVTPCAAPAIIPPARTRARRARRRCGRRCAPGVPSSGKTGRVRPTPIQTRATRPEIAAHAPWRRHRSRCAPPLTSGGRGRITAGCSLGHRHGAPDGVAPSVRTPEMCARQACSWSLRRFSLVAVAIVAMDSVPCSQSRLASGLLSCSSPQGRARACGAARGHCHRGRHGQPRTTSAARRLPNAFAPPRGERGLLPRRRHYCQLRPGLRARDSRQRGCCVRKISAVGLPGAVDEQFPPQHPRFSDA